MTEGIGFGRRRLRRIGELFVHGQNISKDKGFVDRPPLGRRNLGARGAPVYSFAMTAMTKRSIGALLFFALAAVGLWAQSVDAAFPENDPFRLIADPVFVGMEGFSARLSAARAEGREPLGLVLAGGSARAYAHIGVLQVLEEAGIRPDFIVANSMGAVIGMLYAAGIAPDTIADIVKSVPPEVFFNIVLPTKGGLINASSFVAAAEEMVGHIDLSAAPIPIIVTAEDLKTRRQVALASGGFAKVMATTFAMPAIFEPVPLGEFRLVDGGSSNLVPVGIAAKQSSLLIVSTAFSSKNLDYDNLISVLNRAFDIGKTRRGLAELFDAAPFVIRNEVENVSYMQFARPADIIEKGRESALAALDFIAGHMPPSALNRPMPEALASAREKYNASIPRSLAVLRRGALPAVEPSLRFKLKYKLFNEYERRPMELDQQSYAGLAAVLAAGRTRASLAALAGLCGDPGRQWGLVAGLSLNPADTFLVDMETRLWGDFLPWPDFFFKPDSIEALSSLSWSSKGEKFLFQPGASASLRYPLGSADLFWQARASLSFGAGLLAPLGPLAPGKTLVGFARAKAGFFADTLAGPVRYGPEAVLKAGLAETAWGGVLRARGALRYDMTGVGLPLEAGDAYRGSLLPGKASLVVVSNLEIAWLAKLLEFDTSELFLFKEIEIGPFLDCAWLWEAGAPAEPDAWAAGLAFSATMSFAGLSPFDFSFFAGVDSQSALVLGLRAGRLFPAVR